MTRTASRGWTRLIPIGLVCAGLLGASGAYLARRASELPLDQAPEHQTTEPASPAHAWPCLHSARIEFENGGLREAYANVLPGTRALQLRLEPAEPTAERPDAGPADLPALELVEPDGRTVHRPFSSSGASASPALATMAQVTVVHPRPGAWKAVVRAAPGSGRQSFTLKLSAPAAGLVWYVNAAATGADNGTSWDDAFVDLQSALTAATSGDEIWVAAGTYLPSVPAGRTATFQLKSWVTLYGGFAGGETAVSQRDVAGNPTVLSGDLGTGGDNSDNSYHVVTGANSATLDGFTVTLGNANGTETAGTGAGLCNYSVSPTVANCTFTGNTATAEGGAAYNETPCTATFTQCSFSGNTGLAGGAIYNRSCSPVITGCTFDNNVGTLYGGAIRNFSGGNATIADCSFTDNSSGSWGGAIFNEGSTPTILRCAFDGNDATTNGGSIYNHSGASPSIAGCSFRNGTAEYGGAIYSAFSSSPAISNCVFAGNSVSFRGGAIRNYNSSSPVITNCTFAGNSADLDGGAIANLDSANPTIRNCILWDNTAGASAPAIHNSNASVTVSYSCVQGGWTGTGNIDADPLFADAAGGDFHLKSSVGRWTPGDVWVTDASDSPCIDAGDPSGAFAYEPSPNGGRVNMGAYGNTAQASKSTLAMGVTPSSLSLSSWVGNPAPATDSADITRTGTGTLRWTAWSDKPWLQLSPTWGTTTTETDNLGVSAIVAQPEAWTGVTTTTNAPPGRENFSMVWTGKEMIVWGGRAEGGIGAPMNTGARYDPATDTWTGTVSTIGAPSARAFHSAVWTGREMIVWGGYDGTNRLNDGYRYNPTTDTWLGAVSTVGAPTPRAAHSAVWTGTEMIVWGGRENSSVVATGARYDPATNAWTAMPMTGAPAARTAHTAVWTGTKMIVWGGRLSDSLTDSTQTGARYDPVANEWQDATSTTGALSARNSPASTWTGTEMIVWGGSVGDTQYNTGARYDPASDSWLGATTAFNAPEERTTVRAIWTGKEMIVWGGYGGDWVYLNTGGRYRPPISLAAGTYTGTVTVTDPNAGNDPQTVAVTLDVVAPPPPTIGLTPGSMNFTTSIGINPAAQPASVTNTAGSNFLRWTAWSDKPWLQLSPTWGTTTTETDTLGVSAVVSQAEAWGAATSTTGAPSGREDFSMVWTGKEMIVWGGNDADAGIGIDTGGRYDPATNTWLATSTASAPAARRTHAAVWTGKEMIIWGGQLADTTVTDTGARYDPATDAWLGPISTDGAPSARTAHTAVWTGTEMVIWGGYDAGGFCTTGGRYNPATDTWTPVSTVGAPGGRNFASAVWTGTEMVVWGGYDGTRQNDGARYNPATDTWVGTVTATGAPAGRDKHAAVWTGTEMIVWGGDLDPSPNNTNTGGRYRLATDTWLGATTMTGAPTARRCHKAVWTGADMIFWGGFDGSSYVNTGARYRPPINLAVGTYTGTVTVTDPNATNNPQTVAVTLTVAQPTIGLSPGTLTFTTTEASNPSAQDASVTNTGAGTLRWTAWSDKPWLQLSPTWGTTTTETDTLGVSALVSQTEVWGAATSTTSAPSARCMHSAVWTGKEMIIWGGAVSFGDHPTNTGGRYDPATNTWTGATSTAGAPIAIKQHGAVWTGKEMIVWGGRDDSGAYYDTGHRYDPATDTWLGTISTVGAPSARNGHTAVWTGTQMIVWGGADLSGALGTGGRYDPATDTWLATSTINAPPPRYDHTAIWTGTEMIVWGGTGAVTYNTGYRYDPVTNSWSGPISTSGAPAARYARSAVWTGSEMIVWGGYSGSSWLGLNDGARYNPATDTWAAMTPAPISRYHHSAIWTGKEMIVWGGYHSNFQNSGRRYYPPISLAAGTYTGTVTVRDPNATNNPQTIGVTLVVNPDLPPTISDIPDQTTDEDVAAGPLAFTVNDAETLPGNLTLTKSSSNLTLVPTANIVIAGTGTDRTVTVTPAANQSGTATITITVTDERGQEASDSFLLTVSSVSDPPTISAIADQTTDEDTAKGPIAFTVGDAETPLDDLVITKSSSNTALVPATSILLGGTGASRTVTLVPEPNAHGATVITLTVTDGDGLQASESFALTVNSVNDPPVIESYSPGTPLSMVAETSQLFSVTVDDADGDTLTYAWEIDGVGTGTNSSSMLYSPTEADVGARVIKVTVTDGHGGSDSQTWNVTVLSSTPAIALSTTALTPFCNEGQDAAAATFDVWNSSGNTLSYTVSDDAAWLSCSPTSGSSTGEHDVITVTYDTDELTPGTHTATITVAATGASNTPQTISVTLTVNAMPRLGLSVATLAPTCKQGQIAAAQTFEVWNSGVDTLSYTVSDDVDWLSCTPASGTSTGEHDPITVTYDTSALAAGTHTATITVADAGAANTPQTIAVTLTVTRKSSSGGGSGCALAAAPAGAAGLAGWLLPYLAAAGLYALSRLRRIRG